MKKIYIAALALAAALSVGAENKFDARGEIIVGQYRQFIKDPSLLLMEAKQLPFDTDVASRADVTASASVVLAEGVTRADIEALGFAVNAATRSVLLINGPMDDIIALAETDLVKSVSFAQEVEMQLDYARQFTGVDVIHAGGDNLPQAYTGKGVITGIFDTGFYPDHINFKDADSNCRISNFWHVTASDGSTVKHYDTPETNWTDNSSSSHGTHTLGCMSGYCHKNVTSMIRYDQRADQWESVNPFTDRNGKPVPFYGMAKDAEIVVSAGSLTDQSMMAGLGKIEKYIKDSGKPGVINLSIGSVIGPRDGSDAFTSFLDDIAAEIPVCVSAGNDGDSPLSLSGSDFRTFIAPVDDETQSFGGAIDIWGDTDEAFTVTPVIYDLTQKEVVYSYSVSDASKGMIIIGTSNYTNTDVTDKQFDRAFSSSSLIIMPKRLATNDRYNVYVQYSINYNQTTNKDHNFVFGLMVKGKDGRRIDLANRSTSGSGMLSSIGQEGWSEGSTNLTINSMACGHNTIAVGAWNTRNEWGVTTKGKSKIYYPNAEAEGLGLDEVAGYSSYGALVDGRRKPDLCAPGTGIISSVSTLGESSLADLSYPCASYTSESRRDIWGLMQGTSMSSPVVAGAIALWLEADPELKPAQIREIAMNSCDKDEFVSAGDPLRWGAGKFNALAGLKQVLGLSGINDVVADADGRLQITPTGNRAWTISALGCGAVEAKLYNVSGRVVAEAGSDGEDVTIEAPNALPGVYILSVNGSHNTKVILK